MLVSIIITNYNYGAYLQSSIDSALRQRYQHVEVIVVDDGSTDNSHEIIDSYGGRIVPILTANGGQCSCCNLGFQRSRGEGVIFLDADDVLFEDAVELHVERLKKIGVVKSNGYLQVADQDLRPTRDRIPRRLSESGDYRKRFLRRGPLAYRPSFTSGNAWSRGFLARAMPLPSKTSVGVDGYLTAIDPLFGRIESMQRPVGLYRVHDKNKGPLNPHYGPRFLRERITEHEQRIYYAASWANRLGYFVDPVDWMKRREWRLALASHALQLRGDASRAIPFLELVFAPLQTLNGNPIKTLGLIGALALTKILPRHAAVQFTDRLLIHVFGKRRRRLERERKLPRAG